MKDKSTIIGAALAALALVVIVIGIFLVIRGKKTDDLPVDPETVLVNLPGMSPEEQEKMMLAMSRYDPKDPRADQALLVVRKVMKDSSISPQGRAAAIRALGAKKDYQSMTEIADCLYLDDDKDFVVRKAALEACNYVMGISMKYDPAGTAEDRKPVADDYMKNAELWKKMKGGTSSK